MQKAKVESMGNALKKPTFTELFLKIVPKHRLSGNTSCFECHLYFIISLDIDWD